MCDNIYYFIAWLWHWTVLQAQCQQVVVQHVQSVLQENIVLTLMVQVLVTFFQDSNFYQVGVV